MKCPQPKSQRRQRQGTKTPSVTEHRKNLGRNQAQSGGSSPLARRTSSLFQLQQSQIVRAPLVPVVFLDPPSATGSGDCSDLGIRNKKTNISVDV